MATVHSLQPKLRRGDDGRLQAVVINTAENPVTWLMARGLISVRQFEAGERLRADYETAALGQRVTMRWETRIDGKASGLDPTTAQIAAKRRFDGANSALGAGLSDIAWRVICNGEGLAAAERGLGWPARSGKLVLGFALERLADHFGL